MPRDLESTNLEAAAYLAREADPGCDDRPSPNEYADEPPRMCIDCGEIEVYVYELCAACEDAAEREEAQDG